MKTAVYAQVHHGVSVFVNPTTENIRSEECLCMNCKKMYTCPIAAEGLKLCTLTDIAFIVTRCPKFIKA